MNGIREIEENEFQQIKKKKERFNDHDTNTG